jgi:hypothetical protein
MDEQHKLRKDAQRSIILSSDNSKFVCVILNLLFTQLSGRSGASHRAYLPPWLQVGVISAFLNQRLSVCIRILRMHIGLDTSSRAPTVTETVFPPRMPAHKVP